MLNCRSIANQISLLVRGVFAGENSRYHRLHQSTRVAAAIAAHETTNRISSRVKTWDRFFIFVQGLTPAAYQDSTHRKDRKSTRLNSSHVEISYAVFCLKKKK